MQSAGLFSSSSILFISIHISTQIRLNHALEIVRFRVQCRCDQACWIAYMTIGDRCRDDQLSHARSRSEPVRETRNVTSDMNTT